MANLIIRVSETGSGVSAFTDYRPQAGTPASPVNDANPAEITASEAEQALGSVEQYLNAISGHQVDLAHLGIRVGTANTTLDQIASQFRNLANRVSAIRTNSHVIQHQQVATNPPRQNPINSFELSFGVGGAWRSSNNARYDRHSGFSLDASLLWPNWRFGNNNWRAAFGLYLRHENVNITIPAEFGPPTESYANFLSWGLQAYIAYNPGRFFEVGAGLRAGVVGLHANCAVDGSRGFRYNDNIFPSCNDSQTLDVQAILRIGAPRIMDTRYFDLGAMLLLNIGSPGSNTFNLNPYYDTSVPGPRNEGQPSVPTLPIGIGLQLIGTFDLPSASTSSSSQSSSSPTAPREGSTQQTPPQVPPQTPPVQETVAPTPNTPAIQSLNYNIQQNNAPRANNPRAFANVLQRILNTADNHFTEIFADHHSIALAFQYTSPTQGTISTQWVAVTNSNRSRNIYPNVQGVLPEGEARAMGQFLNALQTDGIPKYTGSRAHEIRVMISRNGDTFTVTPT